VVVRQKFSHMMMPLNDVGRNSTIEIQQFTFDFIYLVLPADLERIETTFRDLTNGSGELSYANFKRDVFANFLPEKLATVRLMSK